MQQNGINLDKLETLLDIIQKDFKALKAGDHAARARLVDETTQLQRAIETPAERTFKMRFGACSFIHLLLIDSLSLSQNLNSFSRQKSNFRLYVPQFLQQFAIRILIEDGVFNVLCARGDPKISTKELSQITGEDKLLIGEHKNSFPTIQFVC